MRMLVRTHFLRSRTRKQGGEGGRERPMLRFCMVIKLQEIIWEERTSSTLLNPILCANTDCVIPSRILSTKFLDNGTLIVATPCVCRPHSGRV